MGGPGSGRHKLGIGPKANTSGLKRAPSVINRKLNPNPKSGNFSLSPAKMKANPMPKVLKTKFKNPKNFNAYQSWVKKNWAS
jgi:hypothetical protein